MLIVHLIKEVTIWRYRTSGEKNFLEVPYLCEKKLFGGTCNFFMKLLSQPQPSQIPAEAKLSLGLNECIRTHPYQPPKIYTVYISAISQRIKLKFCMIDIQVARMNSADKT